MATWKIFWNLDSSGVCELRINTKNKSCKETLKWETKKNDKEKGSAVYIWKGVYRRKADVVEWNHLQEIYWNKTGIKKGMLSGEEEKYNDIAEK